MRPSPDSDEERRPTESLTPSTVEELAVALRDVLAVDARVERLRDALYGSAKQMGLVHRVDGLEQGLAASDPSEAIHELEQRLADLESRAKAQDAVSEQRARWWARTLDALRTLLPWLVAAAALLSWALKLGGWLRGLP